MANRRPLVHPLLVAGLSLASCASPPSEGGPASAGNDVGGKAPVDAASNASDASNASATSNASGNGSDGSDAGAAPLRPPSAVDASAPRVDPPSLCGADDWFVTNVSPTWGPAWAKPDPNKVIAGWPLEIRYELWWLPMPKRVLSYRITVPATFDADPSPTAWPGYVRTAESPSTPVANYESALSETACDTKNGVPSQATNPPYALSAPPPPSVANTDTLYFRVRPKQENHCAGQWALPCLEPGRTYYFNTRLSDGCAIYAADGTVDTDPSRCQPMIHVMRPKQVTEL